MRRTQLIAGKYLKLPGFFWLLIGVGQLGHAQSDTSALQIQYALSFEGTNAGRYAGLLESQTFTLSGAQSHSVYVHDTASGLVMPEVWVDYAQEIALVRIGDDVYEQPLYNLGQQAIIPPGGRYEELLGTRRYAGYACKGYRAALEMPQLGGEVEVELWVVPELAISAAEDTSLKEQDVRLARGLLGLPLYRKIEMKALNVTLVSTATRVERAGTLPPTPKPTDGFDPRLSLPTLPPAR